VNSCMMIIYEDRAKLRLCLFMGSFNRPRFKSVVIRVQETGVVRIMNEY
jgi:hypothetical protein